MGNGTQWPETSSNPQPDAAFSLGTKSPLSKPAQASVLGHFKGNEDTGQGARRIAALATKYACPKRRRSSKSGLKGATTRLKRPQCQQLVPQSNA